MRARWSTAKRKNRKTNTIKCVSKTTREYDISGKLSGLKVSVPKSKKNYVYFGTTLKMININ